MNKRGQSEIIAIVLIIVLVLVAIALLWTPIKNLISNNVNNQKQVDCMKVDLAITSAVKNGTLFKAVIARNDGETGIVMSSTKVFIDGLTSNDGAAIAPLGTLVITNSTVQPSTVKVATAMSDGKGGTILCANPVDSAVTTVTGPI